MPPPLCRLDEPSDRSFMDEVYKTYRNLIFSEISKLVGNDPALEDLVQDCLVGLTRHLPTLRELDRSQSTNYIITAARNTAKNHLRSQSRAAVDYLDEALEADPRFDPEQDAIKSLDMRDLEAVWYSLDYSSRLLLQGKYIYDQSDEELALLLGCKSSSVRMLLSRARQKARSALSAR